MRVAGFCSGAPSCYCEMRALHGLSTHYLYHNISMWCGSPKSSCMQLNMHIYIKVSSAGLVTLLTNLDVVHGVPVYHGEVM